MASIKDQISAMNASITSLEAVDKELKVAIQTLESKDASLQDDLDKLRSADTSLEAKIGELKTYVDNEISNTKEWVTATFATIEKYNEIVNELASLKELIKSNHIALDEKIDASVTSIKTWVNETLKGYYTTTEVDELLKTLQDNLDTLLVKLDNLLRDFIITFDDTEIGILGGGTTSVGYTIIGATDKTIVKALGQNGWSAKVVPNGTDKGIITVTAPNPMTNDEIIVLVYDGEFRTIMSSINFVTGVVTASQSAFELKAEAGTVNITVTSNLNYKVSIPEDANDWLSVADTKATKTEAITFAYTANDFSLRRADVSFTDEEGNIFSRVSFIQQGSATEVTLHEAGKLLETLGSDLYQSITSLIIRGPLNGTDILMIRRMTKLKRLDLENARIVAGGAPYYESYTTTDNCIGERMFTSSTISEIILPSTAKSIGRYSFSHSQISRVKMFDSITTIGEFAFDNCTSLNDINLSNSLTRIEPCVFNNSGISKIYLHENITSLGYYAFGACANLKTIVIPKSVTEIERECFQYTSLNEIHIQSRPESLTLGDSVFNYYGGILYIPKGTYDAYFLTELGNFKTIIEE